MIYGLMLAAYLLTGLGLGAYSLYKVREPTWADKLASLAVLTLLWPVVVIAEWMLFVDAYCVDDAQEVLGKWEAVEDKDFQIWYVRWSLPVLGKEFHAKAYHSGTLDARWLAEKDAAAMNRNGVTPSEFRSIQ